MMEWGNVGFLNFLVMLVILFAMALRILPRTIPLLSLRGLRVATIRTCVQASVQVYPARPPQPLAGKMRTSLSRSRQHGCTVLLRISYYYLLLAGIQRLAASLSLFEEAEAKTTLTHARPEGRPLPPHRRDRDRVPP